MQYFIRISALLVVGLALGACPGKDGDTDASESSSPTATSMGTNPTSTSSTSNESTGMSSSSGSSSSSSSSSGTTQSTTTTGDTMTSTSGTGTTTGGADCEIELPDPGQCKGFAPLLAPTPKHPWLAPQREIGAGAQAAKFVEKDDAFEFATTGCAFIDCNDAGDVVECDLWAQDCPEGEKCNAWADDGGSSWNAAKCVPVDLEPDKIGEPCTVEGSGVSGLDSCALGAMCWDAGDDNMGTCVELCTCSPNNPICTTTNTACTIINNGVLILCLPVCDPLDGVDACADGDLCISTSSGYFQCVLDASGDGGAAGDPCEYANGCNPGLFCADSSLVPGCNSSGCCAPYCDINQVECPMGTECTAWYGEGQAPKCFEDIGACVI